MALAGDHVVVKMDDAGGTPREFAAGDIISVDLPLSYDQFDVTGFGDAAHSFIDGQLQAQVAIRGYVTTTASVGTHTVFRDAYQQGKQVTLEVQVGQNAPPTTGDPKYTGEFFIESYVPMIETGKAVMFAARLRPATNAAPAWGVV
ncbi:MAG: hypothetical protein IAE89_04425 [Anaerolineae bacterium]|nr:hypothetical protein [Anaerolineae bacterium]